jgi:PAS domain S-box-containing protein
MNVSAQADVPSQRAARFASAFIALCSFSVCTILALRVSHDPLKQWILALPLGIALAHVLRAQTSWFPLALIYALASGAAFAAVIHPRPLWSAVIAASGMLVALCMGRMLLRRAMDFDPRLPRLSDATSLLFVAAPITPVAHALTHAGAMFLVGEVNQPQFVAQLLAWYTGGFLSCMVVSPLLLTWNRWPRVTALRAAEAAFICVAITGTAAIAFSLVMENRTSAYLLAFLPVPLVIWSAVRFGPRGATASVAVVTAAALYSAASRHDPLDHTALAQTLQLLPAFIAVMSATALCLAVSTVEAALAYDKIASTERRYRELVEETNVVAWEADPLTFSFTFVSGAAQSMLGYPLSAWLEPGFRKRTVHPADRDAAVAECKAHLRAGCDHTMEYRMVAADGRLVWIQDIITVRALPSGKLMLQGVLIDITQRMLQSQAIAASEQRFRDMFEGHHCVMLLIDCEAAIISDANAAAARFYGYAPDKLRGTPLATINPADPETVRVAMLSAVRNERNLFEFTHTLADGSVRDVEVYSSPLIHQGRTHLFSIVHDVSERKLALRERDRLGAVMIHSQKMESLGLLAGGVAHDFNNLLTAILGNTALARSRAPQQSPLSTTLQTIEQSAMRAADLTRQLLAYAGKGRIITEPVDVSSLAVEMVNILAAALPSTALISLDVAAGLPSVNADATQIRQVVMNLLTNAADALAGASGTVRISTGVQEVTQIDLHRAYIPGTAPPGTYVYIQVEDTGQGMSEATLSRIFDPFFTTKSHGRGLGLAAILGIIRLHAGAVLVRSTPGEGTTFRVLLPIAEAAIPRNTEPATIKSGGGSQSRVLGTIIEAKPDAARTTPHTLVAIIDDEPLVANLAAVALRGAGYKTHICLTSQDALLHLGKLKPDLLLIDHNLPGMSGADLLARLRRQSVNAPALFTSGGNPSSNTQPFLAKPFTPEQLIQAITSLESVNREKRASQLTGTDPVL